MRKCFYLPWQRTPRALPAAMLEPRLRGAARRAHGSSAEHAMRDLIASDAPLRTKHVRMAQNITPGIQGAANRGPAKTQRSGFGGERRSPPRGFPPGTVERLSFCPERQNEGCGACDDEARLSPLSFVVQRKMGPPEVASCRARLVKRKNAKLRHRRSPDE